MKVLILSASTGGGHNRAANALKEYIINRDKNNEVSIVDALEQTSKFLNFCITRGYKSMAMWAPEIYGAMYRNANKDKKTPTTDFKDAVLLRLSQGLNTILEREDPDIVITTHPFINNMLTLIKQDHEIKIPIISIVTDFIPHRSYLSDVDAYVCATDETARYLTNKYDVSEDLVFPIGMPIFQRFYSEDRERNRKTYKQLGFSSDKRTILIMAGSFGVTDILKIYESIVNLDEDFQIIVITGKNRKLYNAFAKMLNKDVKTFYTYRSPKWIEKLSDQNPIKLIYDQSGEIDKSKEKAVKYKKNTLKTKPTKLFYFISNVEDYMHISDLIITKPGGLTTSESLACELPLAIFQAFPGQEEDNANFLVEKGTAIMLRKGKSGAKQIEGLIRYPEQLDVMKDNCHKLSKGDACENIYDLMIDLLDKQDKEKDKK